MALQYYVEGYDENGEPVYGSYDDAQVEVDNNVYTPPETSESTDGQGGVPVQVGSNWFFPNADGTYSINGGSATFTADALRRFQNGDPSVTLPEGSTATPQQQSQSWLDRLSGAAGNAILKRYTGANGDVNWANVAKDAATAYMATQSQKPNQAGYNIPVPELTMQRQQINYNDPNRRPGSSGLNYFTDPKYAASGSADALGAAKAADNLQAQGIKAAYTPAAAPTANPYLGKTKLGYAPPAPTATNGATTGAATNVEHLAVPQAQLPGEQKMAAGGLASFAQGGDNYLQGPTDGMADKLNTSIDNHQAAKLSHGEFVIPADVVSHLGNGNSDAGAQKLYDMMARIRKARTGNSEQGKRINPDKFMPGGLAKYAGGGAIAFSGEAGSAVTAPPATQPASTSSSDVLSEWAGPSVSGMISKGYAASNAPYQQYKGPLTAGESDLQKQAFAGAQDMATTGYTPTTFSGGTFDTAAANKYMNPYLSASLDPQLKELQRQSQINNMTNAGKLTQAGAYGGSRQAILQGEENRNLLDKSQGLISSGYNTAYNNAMAQYNADQGRNLTAQQNTEQSRQFSAGNALEANRNLANLGTTERGIESEGLAADKAAFEAQRDNPLKMAQYQKDLLTGLPITTTNKNTNTSDYTNILGKLNDLEKLYARLNPT